MPKIISKNPANNYEKIGSVEITEDEEISKKVASANKAKETWKELGVEKRAKMLRPLIKKIEAKKDEFADIIMKEVGKPLSSAKGEVEGAIDDIKWFLDNAGKALKEKVTLKDGDSVHKIVYEPFGTAAVITPWNFPLGMCVWGVIPNLVAGNTVVFKISEECPLSGRLFEEVMNSIDLPEGVFAEIYGAGETGHKLVTENIDLIWFTGSTHVGRELYKIAGKKFIKAILEMGGSSPSVVFEDVDLPKIIPRIYAKRFSNCGQSCNATKRLIVHESIFEEIVDLLKNEIESKKVGRPDDKETDIGPLVAERQVKLLQEQIDDAVEKGAKIITGGEAPDDLKGAYFKPTLITDITRDMRVWKEEVFGPTLPIVKFKTEEEAVELANDTKFGLGSNVYSKDLERAKRVALRIKAGTVEINGANRWETHLNPFGGYKESGMGREHGMVGFRELNQVKVVSIAV